MNPRLFELFPDGIGFNIIQATLASAGLEQRFLKKLLLARRAAEPAFLFRVFLRHGPKHPRIISIQPVRQPMGTRREQGGMRVRAYRSNLTHKKAERVERHPQSAIPYRSILLDVALQDAVERRAVRRRRPWGGPPGPRGSPRTPSSHQDHFRPNGQAGQGAGRGPERH